MNILSSTLMCWKQEKRAGVESQVKDFFEFENDSLQRPRVRVGIAVVL